MLRALACLVLVACGDREVHLGPLRINEVVADNEGVWVDEAGQTEDLIELVNVSSDRIWLDRYFLGDRWQDVVRLPARPLGAGERIVLFADDDVAAGEYHLPFKIASDGEEIFLREDDGTLRDRFSLPPMQPDQSFARFPDGDGDPILCRYASPSRKNGASCGPAARTVVEQEPFEPYTWPETFPAVETPLALTELALRPAEFIELRNTSARGVALADYQLRIAAHAPGLAWPAVTNGVEVALADIELAPGERVAVPVTDADVAALESFEGVVTVFARASSESVARVDFMAWPAAAVLARYPAEESSFVYCAGSTPGESNGACAPVASRPVPGRLRYLRTPADFAALAAGGTELGLTAVKVIVDMAAGDAVHLLGSRDWDLHYTFVREQIEHEPHLDRCIPEQNAMFSRGWDAFSREQYLSTDTRRYLLGTLVEYAATGDRTLEFETGDQISAEQMRRAFFAIAARLTDPKQWAIRPQGPQQFAKAQAIEGTVPLLPETAPFSDMTLQPLAPGVGFGVLEYVPSADLAAASLGIDVIVVTDDVPNDVPLVGGLITEAFQTPLSHVNVLSRGRGTPNMALRDARADERVAPLLGTLVRFEVSAAGFDLRAAEPADAEAFWATRRPTGERVVAPVDEAVRGVLPLESCGLDDVPAIGAKAAQLAELTRVVSHRSGCPGPIRVPENAFAIPVVHYLEHFSASGAEALLAELLEDEAFRTDPHARAEGLDRVRALILAHPVDPSLLEEVTDAVSASFGDARVRLRSSSNLEDLPNFNGAGLHTSASGEVDDTDRRIDDALRTVWASLWNLRAYDERELSNIDQRSAAMGVLVHEAFRDEAANGIGISRNIFDGTRGDIYYFNVQIGEVSVANPAPDVTTEQYLYRFGRDPRVVYQDRSSLVPYDVLTLDESMSTACTLGAIHSAFRPLLDPDHANPWFAMDIEFKFWGPERALVVKQARPYSFGDTDIPADCREF